MRWTLLLKVVFGFVVVLLKKVSFKVVLLRERGTLERCFCGHTHTHTHTHMHSLYQIKMSTGAY